MEVTFQKMLKAKKNWTGRNTPVSQHLDAKAEGLQLQGQPGLHSENKKGKGKRDSRENGSRVES